MVEINNILAGFMSYAPSQRIRHSRQGIIPIFLSYGFAEALKLAAVPSLWAGGRLIYRLPIFDKLI